MHVHRAEFGAAVQRRHVLAGIEQAARDRRRPSARGTASSSSLLNCAHIWLIFSRPTPCSPVMLPPTATHSSRIRAPSASARSSSPGALASKRISGCMLPSPAWNTFATRRPYLRRQLRDALAARAASSRARNGAVHAVVVGRDAPDRGERVLAAGPEALPLGFVCASADVGRAGCAQAARPRARSPRATSDSAPSSSHSRIASASTG